MPTPPDDSTEMDLVHFFSHAPDPLCIIDFKGRIERLNRAWDTTLGSAAIARGVPLADLISPVDRDRLASEIARLSTGAASGADIEFECLRGDGAPCVLSFSAVAVPDRGLIYITARNVTAQRRAREAAATKTSLLHSLLDNLPDRMYVKDRDGHYLIDNLAHAHSVKAASSADVTGKTVYDFFPPALAEKYTIDDRSVINGDVPLINREEPITDRQGRRRWASTTKVPLHNAAHEVIGIVCISRDVTERRRADRRTRALRAFLDSIIENIPNMIFVKDARELRFIRLNRAGEKLLGITRERIVGKNDHDLFSRQEADTFTANDRAVLESRQLLDIPEEPVQTPQGIRYLHTQKIPLYDRAGRPKYLLGISEDITHRKQADEQLREQNIRLHELARAEHESSEALRKAQAQLVQTEKLAALGQLVAGVAHEINNPLAFVSNNVAVLQRDMLALRELLPLYEVLVAAAATADETKVRQIRELEERIDLPYVVENIPQILNRSREGLKRIQQIVNDLRDFARQDDAGSFEPNTDLNPGIESTINIVRGRAGRSRVELVTDLQPLPLINCQSSRIHQVVLNLVANAIDACSAGGKVTVVSRKAGDGIEIQIIDTGSGIPAEIRDKIFDPFFTTKPPGQGTGLGLSISHGIISDHGGRIEVHSEPGKGSAFTLHLPRVPPNGR